MLMRGAAGLSAVLALGLAACSGPAPVVKPRAYAPARDSLKKLVVVPFTPRPELSRSPQEDGVSAETAAELVSRFVTEAVAARGIPVVPASDLAIAISGESSLRRRLGASEAAQFAAREFGATAVLLGEVWRYRERVGEALGASRAASVAFEVTLFAAPSGQKLRSARFDETQQALSENILNARRYPRGGTRWLTAAELARWGAQAAVDALAGD
jgi:hypothetical protein